MRAYGQSKIQKEGNSILSTSYFASDTNACVQIPQISWSHDNCTDDERRSERSSVSLSRNVGLDVLMHLVRQRSAATLPEDFPSFNRTSELASFQKLHSVPITFHIHSQHHLKPARRREPLSRQQVYRILTYLTGLKSSCWHVHA